MTKEMWFAFVGMPCLTMALGFVALKLHQRWIAREIARERQLAPVKRS
ncbi:MAG: hypothetical protein ACRDBH_12965 [Bosea sp. (in: a-proteobacteria)]